MISADIPYPESPGQLPRCFLCGSAILSIEPGSYGEEESEVRCGKCRTYLGRLDDLMFDLSHNAVLE